MPIWHTDGPPLPSTTFEAQTGAFGHLGPKALNSAIANR
jgi:hypothetical protein